MSLSAASFSSSVRGDPPDGDSTALNRSRSGELFVGDLSGCGCIRPVSMGLFLHDERTRAAAAPHVLLIL